jgi:hypothetical protein
MWSSEMSLNRRSFLQGIALAFAAKGFQACSDDEVKRASPNDGGLSDAGADAAVAEGGADAGALDAPFGVWRAMREALRSSPDSLADQADKLVAAKDAPGLFAFLRDSIAALPPVTSSTEKSTRWGPAATLRGGAGTPRERADLLASLLRQAGLQANVVMGDPVGDLAGSDAPNTVYLRTVDPAFQPADPPASITSWVAALTGADDGPTLATLDPTGATAQGLFDGIDALLPSTAGANGGIFAVFKVPFVALEQADTTTYLNPLSPNAVYGQPYATNIVPAPAADPLPTFEVTLLMSRADDPETQISLVSETYTLDQIVGRQLVIQTHPSGASDDFITSPLSNVVAFIPTLAVTGPDLSATDRSSLMTTGSWVTQSGDVLVKAADGTVSCNGLPLGKGDMNALAANVATVTVEADAVAFPQIELTVSALDSKGKPVLGLGAAAFAVSDEATPVSFLLRDNGITGPRVVFLVDTTGSQPPLPSAWANAVAAAVFKATPDATVQVVNLSAANASGDGYGITDVAGLVSAFTALPNGGVQSNLYGAILGAVAAAPTLIVLLSDGDAGDMDLATRALTSLAGSAPVLAVTSGTTPPIADSPAMDSFATASGGKSVNGADLNDATLTTTPLSQMLGARSSSPYRLSYTAPASGPATRSVVVTATAMGTATYDVPAQPSPSAAVVGLYLGLTLNNAITSSTESYTRVLGGWIPGSDPTVAGAIDAAAADARAAMLGSAVISFEGAAPSLGTWLADSLTWRLATEAASVAFAAGDPKGGFAALADVPTTIPTEAPSLHVPALPVQDSVIYEQSLRAILFSTRGSSTPYRADILPFTRLTTATSSSTVDVFRTNLLASLRMAVAESTLFKDSTISLLQGKALKLLPSGGVTATDVPSVPKADVARFVDALNQYSDWYRVVASDGSSTAFWAVHPSGSCLGVLPDGSGGGDSPCDSYKGLATVLDILALFSDILGVPFLTLWAELGKLVALAGVETLMAFNGTPVSATGDQQLATIGCSFGSGLLGSVAVSAHFKQVGVVTIATNYVQASAVTTVVGSFATCKNAANPCK